MVDAHDSGGWEAVSILYSRPTDSDTVADEMLYSEEREKAADKDDEYWVRRKTIERTIDRQEEMKSWIDSWKAGRILKRVWMVPREM